MNRRHLLAALAAGPLLLPRGAGAAVSEAGPQPELPKEKLVIVTHDGVHHDFEVEMAVTQDQQMVGLMWREHIPADGGMLFDWGMPRRSEMWMKNTVSSLDMLFIDEHGIIRHIAEKTVPRSLAIIDGGTARATLEAAGGTAERLDIRVGDKVLAQLFGTAP